MLGGFPSRILLKPYNKAETFVVTVFALKHFCDGDIFSTAFT